MIVIVGLIWGIMPLLIGILTLNGPENRIFPVPEAAVPIAACVYVSLPAVHSGNVIAAAGLAASPVTTKADPLRPTEALAYPV